MFVIEQALSVRALQELVTAAGSETVSSLFFIFYHRNQYFADYTKGHKYILLFNICYSYIARSLIYKKTFAQDAVM